MRGNRHLITIFFFFSIFVTVIGIAQLGNWEKDEQLANQNEGKTKSSDNETYFNDVNYFILSEGKPSLHLDATELTHNSLTKKIIFFNPEGVSFTALGEPVHYQAKQGLLHQMDEMLFLDREVHIRKEDSNLFANHVKYNLKNDEMYAKDEVKTDSKTEEEDIYVESDEAWSWTKKDKSRYLGNVKGTIKRKRVYEENVYFEANRADINLTNQKVDLLGDVFIKKQLLKANSLRGEVFLENYNKSLKYFVLYDDVRVVEKVMLEQGGITSSYDRKAFAEKLEGFMTEGKIILTGYPKVFQQSDVIKGNKIILRENTEVIEVDDANTNMILR